MNPSCFYASVCACPNTETECPGIINSPSSGWPPRGFFTEAADPPIDILVVGKNPGHPMPQEPNLYKDRSASDIAEVHLDFVRGAFLGDQDLSSEARRSTRFHKNLRSYLAFFLDVPEPDVFHHAAYTNLVKCSTHGEQDRLHRQTMNECFSRHLIREIEFFRPRVLLALGREVERFLLKAGERGLHRLSVIYIKHPSYHYARTAERAILSDIRAQIGRFLARQ